MNSNDKAIKLAATCDAAVSGAWTYSCVPRTINEEGRDSFMWLSTYQCEHLSGDGMDSHRYRALELLLSESSLDDV